MKQFANAMEVFKLLEKTNCRKCNETTCLAFASKVYLGQKQLGLCPFVSPEILAEYKTHPQKENPLEKQQKQTIEQLKKKIIACDLEKAAHRTGGIFQNEKLMLRIFGKPFSIDRDANMFSDIHINPWITSTVLAYVLTCRGASLTGRWVPFRELEGGRQKDGLFVQRSEKSFKKIADQYTGLFEDLIHIFNGDQTKRFFESDISIVLYPLPRLPVLVCYWKPDDGMPSQLHLFFDASADQNAGIDIVYSITAGIVVMFEKLALRHGE